MFRVVAAWLLGCCMIGSAAAESVTEPTTGMTFVRVPAGCFQFGASSSESSPDSKKVCFSKDFWMSAYEVTQEQYRKISGENPSGSSQGDRYPVERVRWFDTVAFINKLNSKSGKTFRLPSEAEWEYAARSGGKLQQYAGTGELDQIAWYMRNSKYTSHPVGEKRANDLGLYDMSGNVWEWVQDCWNDTLAGTPEDGSANLKGNCTTRVLRGGSWYDAETMLTTTGRLWNDADKFDNNSGFRLILER
ncbi:formylglycine-generating enzyme family protein [Mariprofundus erugo]|uniref:formylglycine-generating enzyme family protein n=1 Tax=Mariprofundus erugo TaxID=2528639 RepID=UPI0010FE926E|nr:SUMF1/EgtB/PvdO family nonheme iron enzyme [Mariprofundus erugo]TLS74873.1 formylglycine-generating enzyme family protein [Mariprofundus erugo]